MLTYVNITTTIYIASQGCVKFIIYTKGECCTILVKHQPQRHSMDIATGSTLINQVIPKNQREKFSVVLA